MNQKVLIVEDDDDIRETLIEVCETEGYQVVGAKNGREALDLLRFSLKGRYVVLLDLMMPVMDGKGFLEQVSAEAAERVRDLFIVVFSAGSTFSHPLIKGFLKKPVDLDEVLNLLNSDQGFTAASV